jgi:hypothetical protein
MTQQFESDSIYRVVVRRALANTDPANLQIHFEAAVLERYRDTAGFSIVRTDTVGRIKKEGGWALDFGIAPEDTVIHAPYGTLVNLPEADREHWAQHATAPPASKMFLQMSLSPASCFDDGELRPWSFA